MVERTPKQSHLDTIRYEIAMLRFCLDKLNRVAEGSMEWNLTIEGVLLHYRCLVEFLGADPKYQTDLSTANPSKWDKNGRLRPDDLQKMIDIGRALNAWFKIISGFLEHMTTFRAENVRRWNLGKMYEELEPALALFQETFPKDGQESLEGLPLSIPQGNYDTKTIRDRFNLGGE